MPRVYIETASNIDRVEFNGKTYRRYPDSPRKHLARYFSRSGGRGFLHRDVWEFHNGPIPAEYQIHHIDGNHLNNDVANLECISRALHEMQHSKERSAYGRSDKQQAHLAAIRDRTKEWHASPEGLAWHSENAKNAWAERIQKPHTCEHCGEPFESPFVDTKFCSKSCGNKAWRKAHPEYEAQKRARSKARRLQLDGS